MIRMILVFLFVFFFLIFSIPIFGIEYLRARHDHRSADLRQLRIVQWAFRVIIFLSGIKLTIIGEENVPRDEAVLYVGNHRSYFDIIISYSRCPGVTGYIAKDSIAKVPLLSTWMRRLHCLFINRKDIKESLKTILSGIDNIKNGISMCIYPEGTRGKSPSELDMSPFKEGSLKMADKTNCKIIPMAITNSANVFENHLPWIHSTHVILEYGAPIDPASLTKEQRKKLGNYCQDAILTMLKSHPDLLEQVSR